MSEAKWVIEGAGVNRVARMRLRLSAGTDWSESMRAEVEKKLLRRAVGLRESDLRDPAWGGYIEAEIQVAVERRFVAVKSDADGEERLHVGGSLAARDVLDKALADLAQMRAYEWRDKQCWVSEEERPVVDGEPWQEVRRHEALHKRGPFRVVSRRDGKELGAIDFIHVESAEAVWDAFKRARPAEQHEVEERVGDSWVRLEKVGSAWVPVLEKGWRCNGVYGPGEEGLEARTTAINAAAESTRVN